MALFRSRLLARWDRILAAGNCNRKRIGLFAAVAFVATLAVIPVRPAQASKESRQHGADLFVQRGCARCHNASLGKESDAPDLDSVGRRMKKRAILQQIQDGGKQMPAFRDILTQAETHDLVDYLAHQKKK
jgi:mono/diheme cytochrome c family protein